MLGVFNRPRGKRDITYADPRVPEFVRALREESFGVCERIVQEARPGDDRIFVCQAATKTLPDPDRYRRWLDTTPGSASALACYGDALVQRAYEVRGARMISKVKRSKLREHVDLLGQAISVLRAAAERAPRDPTPWVSLIGASTIAPERVGAEFIREALSRDRDSWYAASQAIWRMSERWGGSDKSMSLLCRRIAEQTKPDSPARPAILDAHFERVFDRVVFRNDPSYRDRYFSDAVRDEVWDLGAAALASETVASTPARYPIYNLVAYMYTECGFLLAAQEPFQRCEGLVSGHPWHYHESNPVKEWSRRYATALRGSS